MLKPASGKKAPGATAGEAGNNARFLREIEALSKALSLDSKPRPRPLPSSSDHRSLSAGRSLPSKPKPKPKPRPKSKPDKEAKPSSSSSSSSSFWGWKPFKALSHIRHQKLDVLFSLRVHSIESLPPVLADAVLTVRWKRTTDPHGAAASTRPARAFHGAAEFEETLTHRCPVYAARGGGPHGAAKYEARHFLLWAVAEDAPALDLGKHLVDLTRLLPLTLEQLEQEEEPSGTKWSTSFRLSGKAKGASLNVSFGFSLAEPAGGEKKTSTASYSIMGSMDKPGSMVRTASLPGLTHHLGRERNRLSSRSVEDVKVLHEVVPSSKAEVSGLANVEELVYQKYEDGEELGGGLEVDSKPEFEAFAQRDDESPEVKPCTLPEPEKGNAEKESVEPEFMVVDQGVEIATKDNELGEPTPEKIELQGVDKGSDSGKEEANTKPEQSLEEFSCESNDGKEKSLLPRDTIIEDLDAAFCSLSILESEGSESPPFEAKGSKDWSYTELRSNYKGGSMKSKSLSFDDVTESVASEFLNMLGIEHSPFGLSSDSDPESPRERLWKQFEKESFSSNCLFGLDAGVENESLAHNGPYGLDAGVEEPSLGVFSEDFDLSSIVLEAETELQKATQAMDCKSRAKMLEDAETEALMREFGLDEKVFQRSPPGSRGGFGSPIDLPPEEPMELPPLGEGLGPFIQTKDGGFLRSMSPSLFRNAKNKGSLIMQVSSPVVVPAEMGSGIMEILQCLASVGIEKLSVQANKLMPLEDITGKTMQQVAWEASPFLEACERQEFLQHSTDVEPGIGQIGSGRGKKGKGLNLASTSSGDVDSEYVSLEDLAPLAMDKIEALSIEGLRIQSDMSDEEAPANISALSMGEISALEGKRARNSRSLGLEGAAGLQLLDVKDNGDDVDGLMGLSLTLDEWMRLDSGIVDEDDQISDRTSKILAAHRASSTNLIGGGWKGDKRGGKRAGRRCGLLGNNFTVALMVQLRDPLRNYELVGTPMLALIQVERVFLPPKPKIYSTVSDKGNSEQEEEAETKIEPAAKEEEKEQEEAVPQFKITEVHVAGLKTEPGKKKVWGNPMQQQSGSRWLVASGMGKTNKHPFMKSKAVTKPAPVTTTVQPGETLWSISSRVHGTGAKWKELAQLNPHIRNPNVIFPNEKIRLR